MMNDKLLENEIKAHDKVRNYVHVLGVLLLFKIIRYSFDTYVLMESKQSYIRAIGFFIEIMSYPVSFLILSIILILYFSAKTVKLPRELKKKYYILFRITGVIIIVYGLVPVFKDLFQ